MATPTNVAYSAQVGLPLQAGRAYWQRFSGGAVGGAGAAGGLGVQYPVVGLAGGALGAGSAAGAINAVSPSVALAGNVSASSVVSGRIDYVPPSFDDAGLAAATFEFISGVPSFIDIAPYIQGGLLPYSLSLIPSTENGVTLHAAAKRLEFDGRVIASLPASSSFQLQADDGYQATSATTLGVFEPSGAAGQAFREGDIPAGSDVVTSSVSGFQAVVENRWPDGSVKFAKLAWNDATIVPGVEHSIVLAAGVSASGAAIAESALIALAPQVTVDLDPYGAVSLAPLLGAPFRQVVSGPEMSEWHYRAPVGTDPHLEVWFFVRLYASGEVWIRTVVENATWMVADPGEKLYTATITMNGTVRYTSVINSKHHTRWTLAHWYVDRPLQRLKHDGAYLIDTKLWLNYAYRNQTEDAFTYVSALGTASAWYDASAGQYILPVLDVVPMTLANHRVAMNDGGKSPTIGPVPLWDVLYLLSGREDMFNCMLANACAGGTFSMHYRDETLGRRYPIKFSEWPDKWLSSDSHSPPVPTGGTVLNCRQDRAHQPSIGYTAYLTTGDFFYMEEVQFWASYNFLSMSYVERELVKGLFWNQLQPREIAWCTRTLAHAACVSPDGSAHQTEYRNSLADNALAHEETCITGVRRSGTCVNNLGVVSFLNASASPYSPGKGDWIDSPFMQHFLATSLVIASDLKVLSGAAEESLQNVMRFALKHSVGLCGDTNGWPYIHYAAYFMPFMSGEKYPPLSASAWFPDYKTCYDRMVIDYAGLWTDPRPVADGSPVNAAIYSFSNIFIDQPTFANATTTTSALPSLAAAVDHGITGAAEAFARLHGASNWPANEAYFHDYGPNWGVLPR